MFNRMAIPAASIIAAIAITFAAILTAPRAAQAADMKIASVDVRAIYENHPLKLQWEKQVAQEQESRNTKITEYLKKTYNLPDDPAKANLTDDQKKEIQTYLYEKNQEFQKEMQAAQEGKIKEIEENIIATVKKVAQANGYTHVFDSTSLLFGGDNITNDIIKDIQSSAVPTLKPAEK